MCTEHRCRLEQTRDEQFVPATGSFSARRQVRAFEPEAVKIAVSRAWFVSYAVGDGLACLCAVRLNLSE
jgi:hypothetical protein